MNAAKRILSFDNSNLEFADTQLVAISANTVVILKVAFLKYQFAYKVHDGHITLGRQPTGYEQNFRDRMITLVLPNPVTFTSVG